MIVRPVGPDDKEMLQDALAHLSPESSYRRFLSPKSRFSAGELRYLTEVDHRDHEALVAVLADSPSMPIGVARFIRSTDDPSVAEAAIIIGDAFQGQRAGHLLLRLLADAARDRDIHRFSATMLADNHAARRLFTRVSESVDARLDGGVLELVCHLAEQREMSRQEALDLRAA